MKTAMAIIATFAASVALAVDVSTVEELTNALANASSGTEIVIAKKATPYDLSTVACMSRAGHLYAAEKVTLRGATGNPEDVVLVGSTNRILYLLKPDNTIRDITFKGGDCSNNESTYTKPEDLKRGGAIYMRGEKDLSVISNCVFVGNTARFGGAVGSYRDVLSTEERWHGQFFDCMFTNNTAVMHGGAVFNAGTIKKCKFIGNKLTDGSAHGSAVCQAHWLEDCDFIENGTGSQNYGAVYNVGTVASTNQVINNCRFRRNTTRSYGAAIGSESGKGEDTIVTGCLFEDNYASSGDGVGGAVYGMLNVSNCTFTGNHTVWGGAASKSVLRKCEFVGNQASGSMGGGAVMDCTAFDCVFTGNIAKYGAAASGSSLCRCVITNNDTSVYDQGGMLTQGCSFDSCRIQDETKCGILFAKAAFLTNSLISGCGTAHLVGRNTSCAVSMVNCTVVSNEFTRFNNYYDNDGDMHIANSLFFGNTAMAGAYDFDSSSAICVRSISNSVFSVSSSSHVPADALETGSGNFNYAGTAFNPKFVGEEVDSENPYALSYKSPCVKTYHGQVQGWMASATDIRGQGFPRLRDGVVDIGCYQCWLRPLGFMMIFR